MVTKTNLEYWVTATVNPSPAYASWYKEEERYLRSQVKKDTKVLDVACGDGRNLLQIKDLTKNLYGLDHDLIAEKAFNKNFPNKEAKFVLSEAEKMPFDDNYFDMVFCCGSFCNFGDHKITILKEMKRVLKKDGIMILSIYSENAFKERMELYKRHKTPILKVEGTTVYFDPGLGDTISEQFSKQDLENIFKEAGLNIIDLKELEISYLVTLRK